MFFDDPKNRLSVARTHQQNLLQEQQRDRLARQVDSGKRHAPTYLAAAFHWLSLLFASGRRLLKSTPASQHSATSVTFDVSGSDTQSLRAPGTE